MLQLLIAYGSDVNARSKQGSTPLHCPVYRWGGQMTVGGIRLLLKHGANIDARDNEGKTPLQVAVERGRHELATIFSEQGATKWDQVCAFFSRPVRHHDSLIGFGSIHCL